MRGWQVKGLVCFVSLLFLLAGCTRSLAVDDTDRLNLVATTTMLADLTRVIGGENVAVHGLMALGVDPHLYQASAGDVGLMQQADVVVYNGLHLEGKMGEIFANLKGRDVFVIGIAECMDKSLLLTDQDTVGVYDPHIWFDVSLWQEAAKIVAEGLSQADPEHASYYGANLENYLKELAELDTYIHCLVSQIASEQRVLVTAHDAFQYFGNVYGFEVRGLQGISSAAEAGTADVSSLAEFIVERQIKAIFIESSVPPKNIEALQAAVKARGFDVMIGGELYSDSLGGDDATTASYIRTVKANVETIVEALK